MPVDQKIVVKLPRPTLKRLFREERDWLDSHYPTFGGERDAEWDVFWCEPRVKRSLKSLVDKPVHFRQRFDESVREVCAMLNPDGTYPAKNKKTGEWVNLFNAKKIQEEMLYSGITWVTVDMVRKAQQKRKKHGNQKSHG